MTETRKAAERFRRYWNRKRRQRRGSPMERWTVMRRHQARPRWERPHPSDRYFLMERRS